MAEYSELGTSGETLVARAVFALYGPDGAEAIENARSRLAFTSNSEERTVGLAGGVVVAAGLSLPFKSSALANQVRTVVESVDATGAPPLGVAQGGTPKGNFENRGNPLPVQPAGSYMESDVWPSGGAYGPRGRVRLVFGPNGEVWYSPDHYDTFIKTRGR